MPLFATQNLRFLSPQAIYGMEDILNIERRRNIPPLYRKHQLPPASNVQNKLAGRTKYFTRSRCRCQRKKTSQSEQLNTRSCHSTLSFYSGDHFMAIIRQSHENSKITYEITFLLRTKTCPNTLYTRSSFPPSLFGAHNTVYTCARKIIMSGWRD